MAPNFLEIVPTCNTSLAENFVLTVRAVPQACLNCPCRAKNATASWYPCIKIWDISAGLEGNMTYPILIKLSIEMSVPAFATETLGNWVSYALKE